MYRLLTLQQYLVVSSEDIPDDRAITVVVRRRCMYVCTHVKLCVEYCQHFQQKGSTGGTFGNPARGQLNKRENSFFSLSPSTPENLVSRHGFGRSVPRQPARFLHSG